MSDLYPSLVAPDGRMTVVDPGDFYQRLELMRPDEDEFDPGPGNVPAIPPKGPRVLSGSAAQPIPREAKWVDHVGLRRYAEAAQYAEF